MLVKKKQEFYFPQKLTKVFYSLLCKKDAQKVYHKHREGLRTTTTLACGNTTGPQEWCAMATMF